MTPIHFVKELSTLLTEIATRQSNEADAKILQEAAECLEQMDQLLTEAANLEEYYDEQLSIYDECDGRCMSCDLQNTSSCLDRH